MPTLSVLDATGATQTIQTVPAVGQATKSASLPVTLASDQGNVSVAIASGGIVSGTAGTPSTDVLTVQGAASMTAIKVDGSAVTQPVSLASVPSHAVTNAGTFAVQVSSAPTTAVTIDSLPALAAGTANIGHVGGVKYKTVAASQTATVLGATGATGDYIAGILVIPATTSPGAVTLLDNATSITVFTGGATSVSNLVPFYIPIGAKSVSGAWKISTGANVSCIGFGDFT